MAGTAVKFLAQQPKTVAILKDNNFVPEKTSNRFGVLFDTSEIAKKCLQKVRSMMNEQDRLTVITVLEGTIKKEGLEAHISAALGDNAPHDIVVLEKEPTVSVKDRIK